MQMAPLYTPVNPLFLADRDALVEGPVRLADMARLREALVETDGTVEAALRFSREDGRPLVRGRVQGVLPLRCQRCLEAMSWPVDVEILLGIVSGEDEAARLPEMIDPLLVGEANVRPVDIIEDELILALPVVARHEDDDACVPRERRFGEEVPKSDEPRKENPFAALKVLRGGKD